MKTGFVFAIPIISLLCMVSATAETFIAPVARYDFATKKDSSGYLCTIQLSAVDKEIRNGFGLEFGVLSNAQKNILSSVLYFSWNDIYSVNGTIQKQTKIRIGSAAIKNPSYSSERFFRSAAQSNGELWQFSEDGAEVNNIFKIVTGGPFALSFTRYGSRDETTVLIRSLIPKSDFKKFMDCYEGLFQ